MKKIYIFLVLLICSFPIYSQTKFPKEFAVGITGGMDLSKMQFKPITIPQDYKQGLTFGVTARYIEEKYFGIQAELSFTQRGWKEKLEDYPDLNFERTLNYVELPLLSHIFFGNDRIRGFVNLGPKIGYFLSDKTKTNISNNSLESSYESDQQTMAVSKHFDYGIIGGGGLELRFGRQSFIVEGRYYFGLGDIFPNDKKDKFEASANQTISVNVSYLINLKKKR